MLPYYAGGAYPLEWDQGLFRKIFVLGFLFLPDHKTAVLLEKLTAHKPGLEWMHLMLNGIGGEVEAGESPNDAMHREAQEELGWSPFQWQRFAQIPHTEYICECFVHIIEPNTKPPLPQRNDRKEKLVPVDSDRLYRYPNLLPSLKFLIPLARYSEGLQGVASIPYVDAPK